MKKSYDAWTQIYIDKEQKEKHLKETAENQKISVEELEQRLAKIIRGTPDEIVSQIKEHKILGTEHLIFFFPLKEEVEQMKLFKEKIMPKV